MSEGDIETQRGGEKENERARGKKEEEDAR
jgi:hypothetical protein